ncbi:DUF2790 domain-containing protein [Pseudomonas sp. AOB-7]|uniref:DUF2790 domain-containing protein n=1 Tax=Pseudomonas sp. AOB-7 TaxID=2482750 RepID=UPI00273DC593|nr:DUF2790 domain-containing protein [Pseudomonas sp. AOB-7]
MRRTLTAWPSAGPRGNTAATPYRCGLPLNIAMPIAIGVPASPWCEVVTAKMTYRNSAGEVEVLTYEQLSSICSNQN